MAKWNQRQELKVLHVPFHWNQHLLPNLFCGLIATNKRNVYNHKFAIAVRHRPFSNFDSSVSPLTGCRLPPRIFLIKMAAFIWEENNLFMNYLRFTVEQRLWHYTLSSSIHMKWIMKTEPTSRRRLHKVFGKYVLCTETEWRGMLISNRYKVSFY